MRRDSEIPLPPRDLHLPDGMGTRRSVVATGRTSFRFQAAVATDPGRSGQFSSARDHRRGHDGDSDPAGDSLGRGV